MNRGENGYSRNFGEPSIEWLFKEIWRTFERMDIEGSSENLREVCLTLGELHEYYFFEGIPCTMDFVGGIPITDNKSYIKGGPSPSGNDDKSVERFLS